VISGEYAARIAQLAFDNDADAITLPGVFGTMVFARSPLRPCAGFQIRSTMDFALVGHELVHALQINRITGARFLAQYLAEYGYNITIGMAPKAAYECISFEVEAFAFQHALEQIMARGNNKALFAGACCDLDLNSPFTNSGRNPTKALADEFAAEFKKQLAIAQLKCKAAVPPSTTIRILQMIRRITE